MANRIKQSVNGQSADGDVTVTNELTAAINSTQCHPIITVRINTLNFKDSPRLSGADPEHIRMLAEAGVSLPPITVHRPTMRVIDGTHRVQAALLNGDSVIDARLLDCDEKTAFVIAVKANVTHGLPLSPADRKAAAVRIIASHPHWSDRAVAVATGLSDKTVSRLRVCSTAEASQSNTRLGRDGRRHPLNTEVRRQRAADMIREQPDAGLREVARATGLSPATVRDVRQRVDRQEDPVPERYRTTAVEGGNTSPVRPQTLPPVQRMAPRSVGGTRRLDIPVDPAALLAKLRNDPSLRFSEVGRRTLRWLHQHTVHIESWHSHGNGVPDHCAPVVADLARSCAAAWVTLADQLERQHREEPGIVSRKPE